MKPRAIIFLRDIFLVTITSFGGPQGHLAIMHNILVKKRKYFTEEELLEVNALCQMLPGPASTQTIVMLSQKKGGTLLAIFALLIWILPGTVCMSLLVAMFSLFEYRSLPTDFLIFIQPMAVGIIAYAGFNMCQKILKQQRDWFIMLGACIISILINSPWVFPLVIIAGGTISNLGKHPDLTLRTPSEKIDWRNSYVSIGLLVGIFIAVGIAALITKNKPVVLTENFYRFGTITFGGGNVLVPVMFEQFVKHRHYLTSGLAVSQALPGPSFAFAAFAGGMALRDMGAPFPLIGCIIGTVAIFLPGALMAFIIYPVWRYVKNSPAVYKSLQGINAAAVGLVLAAAIILYSNIELHVVNIFVVIAAFCLLQYTRIKAPVLVLLALIAGIIYSNIT
jgi:chromate transporter